MFVATKVVIDIASGRILRREGFEYDGPLADLKKGREAQDKAIATDQALTSKYSGIQDSARNTAAPFVNDLLATKPGELSPYAQAQYASDTRNINDVYNQLKQEGLKGIGFRSGAGTPLGDYASITNSAIRNQGAADTEAYNRAQQNTLGQGLAGIGYLQGQQQLYNPLNPNVAASNAAYQRSQMGSTLGDIGSGILGAANAFGSLGTGFKGFGF